MMADKGLQSTAGPTSYPGTDTLFRSTKRPYKTAGTLGMPCKSTPPLHSGHKTYNKNRYWDWAADSANPSKAAIFDPVTGFGGNGNVTSTAPYTQCVLDGPLTGLRPQYWNTERVPHCLTRVFARSSPIDMLGAEYSPQVVAEVSAETDYDNFRYRLEYGPHAAIHEAIGGRDPVPVGWGDLNPSSSPNGMSFQMGGVSVLRGFELTQTPHRASLLPPPHQRRQAVVALAAAEPKHTDRRVQWLSHRRERQLSRVIG